MFFKIVVMQQKMRLFCSTCGVSGEVVQLDLNAHRDETSRIVGNQENCLYNNKNQLMVEGK